MTNFLNILSILVFLLFLILMIKNNKFWSYYLFFYIAQLWGVFSTYYIEQGIYITEQNRTSFETGATYRLVIQNIIFFLFAWLGSMILNKKNNKIKNLNNNLEGFRLSEIVYKIVVLASILFFVDALITNIVYTNLYTRFNYGEYSVLLKIPILKYAISYVGITTLMLGYFYTKFKENSKRKKVIILSLLIILAGCILQGSKFSTLYLYCLLFLIPTLRIIDIKFMKIKNKKVFRKLLLSILLIIIFISTALNLANKEYSNLDLGMQTNDFIIYRILGLQGHVWWGTDLLANNLKDLDRQENMKQEIQVILGQSDGKYTSGLNALMLFISPTIGRAYIENGVSFTMGFPALLYLLFTPLQIYFMLCLLGIMFGFFVAFFEKVLDSKSVFLIISVGYIYIYGFIQFFTMGRTGALFNHKMYIIVILMLYLTLIHKVIKKKHN